METLEQSRLLPQVSRGTPCGELLRRCRHPVASTEVRRGRWTTALRLPGEDRVLSRDRQGRSRLIEPLVSAPAGVVSSRSAHAAAVALHVRMWQREIQKAEQGQDPNGVVRDEARKQRIDLPGERGNKQIRRSLRTLVSRTHVRFSLASRTHVRFSPVADALGLVFEP